MAGFYVANVVSRYWDQFLSLPWPDQIAYKLLTYIPGKVNKASVKVGIGSPGPFPGCPHEDERTLTSAVWSYSRTTTAVGFVAR